MKSSLKIHVCARRVIPFAIIIFWTPALANSLPFTKFLIGRDRGSEALYGPIILTAFSSSSISLITPYLENRFCRMVRANTCPKSVIWSTSGDRKTDSTAVTIWFFKTPSTAMCFQNIAWFCRFFLGAPHALWLVARMLRQHKRESFLFHLLFVRYCQRKVSMLAFYQCRHHRHRIPTYQLMYFNQSFSCRFSSNIWKDGHQEIRKDSLNAACFPLPFCLKLLLGLRTGFFFEEISLIC